MRLVCRTKLHYKEGNSDKVYEVDLCEADEKFFVNFRYGRRGTDLKEGTKTTHPVTFAEAERIFQKLVDEKKKKGYHLVGETAEKLKVEFTKSENEEERNKKILEKLRDAKAKSNPDIERIIWRAGELKIKEAATDLIKLTGTAKELRDYCIAWSLGFCGAEENVPDLEKLANHRAEYVRRIAREAIFKIAGETKQNELKQIALGKLPDRFQNFIKKTDAENLDYALCEELDNLKGSFDVLTRLYETRDNTARLILLDVLRAIPLRANFFKPVRQIFKIAEYRRDAEVYGILAKRFETSKHGFHSSPWGNWVSLQKEDGTWEYIQNRRTELAKENSRIAYSDKTRDYFRRRSWRTLRRLGEIGNADEYVKLAVGVLLQFSDDDAREPGKSVFYDYRDENGNWNWQNPRVTEIHWDKFSGYLLFNHILYKNSPRYEFKTGSRGYRLRQGHQPGDEIPAVREEAFPRLWEQKPVGLLHLLSESNCQPVHEFAGKALRDCREFIEGLEMDAVLMLLSRPYQTTARLGFEIAKKLYDPANPRVELAIAVALSADAEARAEGFGWISQGRELFARDASVLLKLFASKYADAREFAAKLLQEVVFAEREAKNLIAVLIAELVSFDASKRAEAADLGEAMLRAFTAELRVLNFETITSLLAHPLVEIQQFGGNILLNHEISAENLPDELINSLIESEFEQIRNIGVKLFGKLPDENLLKREGVIVSLLSHEFPDIHHSARPIVVRLAARSENFVENISHAIFVLLLSEEKHEGVHSRLLSLLRQLPGWTKLAGIETAKLLINSAFPAANEAGGLILQAQAENWKDEFSVEEIVKFSNHEILVIRQSSWAIAKKIVEKLREEVSYLVRALDSKWLDSREFWREYFQRNFTAEQLTPEILIAICDSVAGETQKFGRDLLLTYFEKENGVEYLLKLSEHPSVSMQFFAANYLESYATDSPEKLEKLAPYFIRVLSLVNRSRPAKDRILQFLETEALKNEKSAKIAAEILARQSATLAIGDKAKMIEAMLKIRRNFPDISLPIKINQPEVRTNAV